MKKGCAYTKKLLPKYLRGHLFKYEQIRITRHLNACPVCRSEYQSLKQVADTRQFLQEITPPEGIVQRMKAAVAAVGRLKILLYRPLWLAAIVGAAALLYVNLLAPRERDIAIENIEKSLPPAPVTASAPTATLPAAAALSVQDAPQQTGSAAAPPAPAPAPEPLVVSITPQKEKGAVRRMNQILHSQAQLKPVHFSETERTVSGNLSSTDLAALIDRIEEEAAKVSYSRKRLESFPAAQPIPFILKLKPGPKNPERAASSQPAASAPTQSVP